MDRSLRILEVLGAEGLNRVLHDVLDRPSLVRAANACSVSVPGLRAQSVPAEKLISELVKRATGDLEARLALAKILDRACTDLLGEVAALPDSEVKKWGSTPPAGRRTGALLYALAADPREAAHAVAKKLLSRMEPLTPATEAPTDSGPASRDEAARLRERTEALRREADEAAQEIDEARAAIGERDSEILALRKHAHALDAKVARLSEENARLNERNLLLTGKIDEAERAAASAEGIAKLSADLKGAIKETQKVLHEVRDHLHTRIEAGTDPARPYLEALASTVRAVQGELAELRRERELDRRKEREALSDLAREVHSAKLELAGVKAAHVDRPPRRKGEPERVGLFVDVQNMYYAARQQNARLDFGALMEAVTRDRRLIRAIAYVVQNRDIDQSGFLAMLQQRNYEVRRKDLKVRADGSSKGDQDMEIALDILDLAETLDVVVLASGDGDFVPLVNRVKTRGPRVEVYSFPGSTAKELIEAADRHIAIDEGLLIRLSPAT